MKILIVDDNKENLYLLETLLKGNGYQVISAINGAEALEKLRNDGFDMIISDILMPVMDGFQLCRECKMDENLQDILFVFYTATYVDEKDEELALTLGADKFIRKPMEPDDFMSIIRSIARDAEERKLARRKPAAIEEREVFKLYSERLVNKLEKKMFDLEAEIARRKKAEEKYRLIAENAKDVIITTDMSLRLTYVSPSVRYLGTRTAEEIMAAPIEELFAPASFEVATKVFLEELEIAKRQPRDTARSRTLELEIKRQDGSTIWTEARINFLRGEEGQPTGLIAVLRDITERKRAEETLLASEKQYRTLFETMAQGVVYQDKSGLITSANPAAERILGLSFEQMQGRTSMDPRWRAIHEDGSVFSGEEHPSMVALRTGKIVSGVVMGVYHPLINESRWILVDAIPEFLPGETQPYRVYTTFNDITERKRAEKEKKQLELKAQAASRLTSLGELVAGVAHEINNPLTGIIGYAQLLADRQDVAQNIKDDLQKIYEESQRTVRIVQNLLRFARQYKPEKSLVDISELLKRTLELEAYKLRTSNIELSTKLAADLPLILADYNQLQQVVLNIITNAQQAIAETKRKGKITVIAEAVGDYVKISISDNGPGISQENITRIFDPFFTTKPEGGGSGLGLSVCHGIVTEHGGNIYAESTAGKGTTFIVELPIATGEQAVIKEEPVKKKGQHPRRKTTDKILIVEDEPAIRAVLTRNLSAWGYQVQAVSNGKDALDKLADNIYKLLLFDLKMAGMNGRELYEVVKKKHPNSAKSVVFITGDVMTPDTHDFLVSTGRPYLIKPFDSKDVTDIIEQVLGG